MLAFVHNQGGKSIPTICRNILQASSQNPTWHIQWKIVKRPSPGPSCQRSVVSIAQATKPVEPVLMKETEQRMKKKVAMWIGYVGTDFKGLQTQRSSGGDKSSAEEKTIEDDLETAIYNAGGILESNYGRLQKVSWTRSSRTDKGVHSACTVISFKMELPLQAWRQDPDGFDLAEAINAHLSPSIRVFAIEPVSKSFNARWACFSRSYDYFLPAGVLGIKNNSSPDEITERIQEFRRILESLEGRHPFHNYTVRGRYRDASPKRFVNLTRQSYAGQENASSELLDSIAANDEEEVPNLSEEEDDDLDEDEDEDEDMGGPIDDLEQRESTDFRGSSKRAYWLFEPDNVDMVTARHFRHIASCTCGELETYSDAMFVRVQITGLSFMLHQVRKMVGTAVAVFRKALPPDAIPISLSRYSRIALPIAPAETLVLARNKFLNYKNARTIQMSSGTSGRIAAFWSETLIPRLATSLDVTDSTWSDWLEKVDKYACIPETEMSTVRIAWQKWQEDFNKCKEKIRQAKAKRKEDKVPIYQKAYASRLNNMQEIGQKRTGEKG